MQLSALKLVIEETTNIELRSWDCCLSFNSTVYENYCTIELIYVSLVDNRNFNIPNVKKYFYLISFLGDRFELLSQLNRLSCSQGALVSLVRKIELGVLLQSCTELSPLEPNNWFQIIWKRWEMVKLGGEKSYAERARV